MIIKEIGECVIALTSPRKRYLPLPTGKT